MERTSAKEADTSLVGAFASGLFALPFVLIIGFVLLLIVTMVAYNASDPHALIPPLSMVALGLTSLLGGFIAARRRRGHPLLSGLLCGLLMNLMFLTLTLFWQDAAKEAMSLGFSGLLTWGLHAAIVLCSVIGAKIGMGKRR